MIDPRGALTGRALRSKLLGIEGAFMVLKMFIEMKLS
jgi:hypothetical protein